MRWFASATNSMLKAAPRSSARESPDRAQRALLVHDGGEARDALLGPAPVDLQEEVVHGAEVVVDQLRLDAGFRRDAPRSHGGVPLPEHQLLRRVEQEGPGLRVRRSRAVWTPSRPQLVSSRGAVLSICPGMLSDRSASGDQGSDGEPSGGRDGGGVGHRPRGGPPVRRPTETGSRCSTVRATPPSGPPPNCASRVRRPSPTRSTSPTGRR